MKLHDFIAIGADTDGLAFKKADEKPFTKEEREQLVAELNSYMDELIRWEDDGVFKRQIVVKAKNYVLQDESGKVKIKGSALKATTKEKALQRFLREVIDLLLTDKKDQIFNLYYQYAQEVTSLTSIDDWCVKKTVTKSVLNPERTNEQRVLDALEESEAVEGDKVYMFNRTSSDLCLREQFDGTYDVNTLLKKLYNTLVIFETVIDIDLFPNYSLERNKHLVGLERRRASKSKPEVIKGGKSLPPTDVPVSRPAFPDSFWNVKGST